MNWILKTYAQIGTHWFQDRFVSKEILVVCIGQRYITEVKNILWFLEESRNKFLALIARLKLSAVDTAD